MQDLQNTINKAWENQDFSGKEASDALLQIVKLLESGKLRVAQKINDEWQMNDWVKKAILIYMKTSQAKLIKNAPGDSFWHDKINQKFTGWQQQDFEQQKIRAVPGCFVRKSSYIGQNVILMPCFVNVGAFIDSCTMIDTWTTVGSCAQIGKNCHISGGVGIGGVLEPIGNIPVIIEDNCFIGARSEIAEGVKICQGSVIAMGCFICASTKIVDRQTKSVTYGVIPKYSVVVPGSFANNDGTFSYCVLIVKKVDEKTRMKTQINDLLRY